MSMPHLNGHHRTTLDSLFRNPASHNVEWHDVLSLLQHSGTVTERHNGDYEVAIGGHAMIVDRPKGHDLEGDQLRTLRLFLATAGMSPDHNAVSMPTPAPAAGDGATCIVLIDHHHAKIFETCRKHETANAPIVLKPADDEGARRRVMHRQADHDHDGGHASEETAYYQRISDDLVQATRIVVLSDGEGRSNAGDHLVAYLERHHGDIAHRIIATDRVNVSQLSDGEVVEAGLALVGA